MLENFTNREKKKNNQWWYNFDKELFWKLFADTVFLTTLTMYEIEVSTFFYIPRILNNEYSTYVLADIYLRFNKMKSLFMRLTY